MLKTKKQLKTLTKSELSVKIVELSEKIIRAGMDLSLGKTKNTRAVFNLRKQLSMAKSYYARNNG